MTVQVQSTDSSFQFVKGIAETFGKDEVQIPQLREQLIDSLSIEEYSILTDAYREIERRNDSAPISEWVLKKQDDAMPHYRRHMFMLFLIFEALAKRGVEPFNSRTVTLVQPPPVLDWSKLPSAIRYLSLPAEKYGIYQFDDEMYGFIDQIEDYQLNELRQIEKLIERDWNDIESFLDSFPMTQHDEARLVYFLGNLTATLKDVRQDF